MQETILIGTLSTHSKGFGFVQGLEQNIEIFIPKRFLEDAIDGDIVKVEYDPSLESSKGFEGKIVEVIERKRKTLYALIVNKKGKQKYEAYSPLLGPEKTFSITVNTPSLKIGDRVVLCVKNWGKKNSSIKTVFHKKLGSIDDPSLDITSTAIEYFLSESFPTECLQEADSFGTIVTKKETEGRVDLTKIECFTIDPKEAKDFDDALSLIIKNGNFDLYVHIADVSHYVKPESVIDKEAVKRSNSTYLPGTCLPMLPENLSNHLCSLKPQVKRLAVTVQMLFDKKGDLLSYQIYRSTIKSQTRFTYEEAKEVLDGKKKSRHELALHQMVELCNLLKKKRKERGSVDFSLPDLRLIIDKKGNPEGFELIEYDITHQLVEEFMLKANELVAMHLLKEGKPTIFRVHEQPAEDKLQQLHQFIRRLGYPLSDKPTTEDIQKIFEQAKNSPHSYHLSVNFIRSMKLAYYSEENVGHFGLSLDHYLHFTSPIRRYSDLIVHRALFDEVVGDLSYIAKHVSQQERNSFKAESSMLYLKKLRLLDHYFDEDPYKIYEGCITKCKPNGIFFELKEFFIEGFIHISKLGSDYYIFYPDKEMIEGDRTRQRFTIGQTIHVEIEAIDLVYRECFWTLSKKLFSLHKKNSNKT
ncbi:MAG: VacB/RNase II family 3'-5' exoribonuclease [Chlamydiales bacterium]|nr:VacB/RNase II family 3'-5' exoribonuclease [Chlamydiales bacterium]